MLRFLVLVVVRMCRLACHVQLGAIKSATVEHESCFGSLRFLKVNGRKVLIFIEVYANNLSTKPREGAQSLELKDLH